MFAVTKMSTTFVVKKYEPPLIYVTSSRTGETYRFLVETDGTVGEEAARFDQGDPRRAAIEYLARFAKTRPAAEIPIAAAAVDLRSS
jgi:hypothetical protein